MLCHNTLSSPFFSLRYLLIFFLSYSIYCSIVAISPTALGLHFKISFGIFSLSILFKFSKHYIQYSKYTLPPPPPKKILSHNSLLSVFSSMRYFLSFLFLTPYTQGSLVPLAIHFNISFGIHFLFFSNF